MFLLELGPVIFGDTDDPIAYLQGKHLSASNIMCTNYNEAMRLKSKSLQLLQDYQVLKGMKLFCKEQADSTAMGSLAVLAGMWVSAH